MTLKSNVIEVASDEQFAALVKASKNAATITTAVNFGASWAPQCADMNQVFDELSRKFPALQFLKVEAEDLPEVSEEFEVAAVPTFVIIRNKKVVDKVEGANAPLLTTLVEKHAKAAATVAKPAPPAQPETPKKSTPEQLQARLKTLVSSQPVMLFMKGTPQEPRCGFSRQLVGILAEQKVTYGSFNILADEEVRAGLKEYSNWPTFPQLYIKGELVGGLDIVKELVETGEFQKMVPPEEDLNTRLKRLTNQAPVMLFMKGDPEQPRCGFFSPDNKVKFDTFDILSDEEVRAGLKAYSNWPTYPQLYAKGELLGGLDIVKEMIENGEFAETIPAEARL
ncbi:glutaredoxin-3 [Zopfochytrium polystomum]|nr:glutaredoxin-3 [Zopfochytrium polystomum]